MSLAVVGSLINWSLFLIIISFYLYLLLVSATAPTKNQTKKTNKTIKEHLSVDYIEAWNTEIQAADQNTDLNPVVYIL